VSTAVTGYVTQINVNPQGGVPKYAVPSVELTVQGVAGDKQRDRRFHGGPQRAVCLYSAELIAALRAEGHPIAPGTTGENLTVAGIDWATLRVGDRLLIGEWVELEITGHAAPCSNIEASFADGLFKRISQKVHPGWSRLYARVLAEGLVREGDAVEHEPA
jgi:MOSC domain-containing protein YiiM